MGSNVGTLEGDNCGLDDVAPGHHVVADKGWGVSCVLLFISFSSKPSPGPSVTVMQTSTPRGSRDEGLLLSGVWLVPSGRDI